MISALILVGGWSNRANGYPKFLFTCENKTFLERQIEDLQSCTDEILVVGRDEEQIVLIPDKYPVVYIHDIRKNQGPAGGIHSGAWHAKGELLFATACDMPFLSRVVIRHLIRVSEGFDAVVPIWEDGKFEPLCAVYRRDAVRLFYDTHDLSSLKSLVQNLNTNFVPVQKLKALDPDRDVFLNVNDLELLSKIKEKL